MNHKFEIRNDDGKIVKLTPQEKFIASQLQTEYNNSIAPRLPGFQKWNALAYEVDMTSLTQILKSVTEQKFYDIDVASYIPVVVGEGAWSSQLLKYRSFDAAEDFETGDINQGSGNARLASVSTAVDAVYTPVKNWAKEITYNVIELQQASRSGNWDMVTSLESARYRNWRLGLQDIAFWGHTSDTRIKGLLTLDGVTSNTTLITERISDMNATEFQALLSGIIEAYRANGQRTAMPTKFIIPEGDYNGLINSVDEGFPLKDRITRLEESFKKITRNPNFEILPCAFADQSENAAITGLNKNRYVLYNDDPDTIRMDLPVNYTNTMQNTLNGFTFSNVGYCQYTGVQAYRPLEILYFDWASS